MIFNDFPGPDYCGDCGHFHLGDCPDRDRNCGSFLCCIDVPDGDSDSDSDD